MKLFARRAWLALAATGLIAIGFVGATDGVRVIAPAHAQVVCPTTLPPATNFTGASVTEGQFKTAVTSTVAYLTCLFGTDDTTTTAKSTLGLATVASTGNFSDLAGVPTFTPTGVVVPYAGTSAPTGWLMANGQAVSRTTFSTLFALVGTTYGAGDGSTTFNVPDLRGRAPFGVDAMGGATAANRLGSGATGGITGTASLAASGGAQAMSLTSSTQLPAHTHSIPGLAFSSSFTGTIFVTTNATGGGDLGLDVNGTSLTGVGFSAIGTGDDFVSGSVSGTTSGGTSGSVGSGASFNVTPPALVLNFIIKTAGRAAFPANENRWPLAKAI